MIISRTHIISYTGLDNNTKSGTNTASLRSLNHIRLDNNTKSGTNTTYCVALKTTTSSSSIISSTNEINDFDHIMFCFRGKTTGTFSGSNAYIQMRMTGLNSNVYFAFTNQSIEITKYSNDYIEGTYFGKDFMNNDVTGSMVVKNLGDNNRSIPW